MKRTKTFTIALLSVLCAAAFALSAVGLIPTKKVAAAEDKTLTYSLSCFSGAGVAKGTLNEGGTWGAVTNAGAKKSYLNIIFGTDSRYITFTFNEAISAEEYVSIDFGMNFFGGSTLTNQSDKAQIYKPAVDGGVVSGTSRTETSVEVDAGWYVDSTDGSAGEMNVAVNYVSIPTSAIKQDDGLVYGFTIRCVAEASTGAHYAIMSDLVAKAATPAEPEEPTTQTLDFNLTDAWLEVGGVKQTGVQADTSFFGGDGSTQVAYTGNVLSEPVTVRLRTAYKAADYGTVEISLCISNWTDGNTIITKVYALSDTEFTNPLASVTTEKGNIVATLTFEAADIAGEDGNITGFVIVKKHSNETKGWQIFADYVKLNVKEPETPAETLRLQAGDLVDGTTTNPRSIVDEKVTWTALVNHGSAYEPYGYVEHPAFKTYSKEKFPGFEFIDNDGTANDVLKAKNVVQTLNLGNVKAANFARLEITYMFTDWLYGSHEFYIYGEKTTAFTDSEGNPTGYAAKMIVQGPSTKFTFKIDDVSALADDSGKIQYIYLMYGTEIEDKGFWNGTQLWVNEVNLIIPEDMPNPVVSEDVASKDVSELMPVGSDGVTFGLTSNGKQSGEEGYGAYSEKVSLKTAAADEITFNFTPTYGADGNFSVYFLLKAKSDSAYSTGGLVFWFSDSNILIGNGTKNDYAKMLKADYPEGAFASGTATKVKISAIPYYLEGVREGYYLALYFGDAETPALDIYVADVDSELGEYTKIVMQDLGKDYSVKISSASATPTAAADVMKVTVATTSGKTTFDKPRAGLALSHFAIDGETVSELKIDGDATYNAETKTLNFNSEGTVKVSFTVTNAFGTFTSNELALTYDDGVANETEEKSGCDCGSSINGIGISALVLAAGAVIIAVKRRKHD